MYPTQPPSIFDYIINNFGFDILMFLLVVVAVAVALIVREIVTWYWKINQIVGLLERIEENTRVVRQRSHNEQMGSKSSGDSPSA